MTVETKLPPAVGQQFLLVEGHDKKEDKPFTLAEFQGFETSISVSDNNTAFPYRPGPTCNVKVYDPQERRDCDNDLRAWRFSFTVFDVKVLSSQIWIVGYSHLDRFTSVDYYVCGDEAHTYPWEHDGMCSARETRRYSGLVQIHSGHTLPEFIEAEPKFELGGPLAIEREVEAEVAG